MARHPNLIEDTGGIDKLLGRMRRVAVLGIKTEAQASQAAFYVPAYLAAAGLDVIPVPAYATMRQRFALRRPASRWFKIAA